MLCLAFDLANFQSSLALVRKHVRIPMRKHVHKYEHEPVLKPEVLFSEHSHEFRGQDVTLLPRIEELLAKQGLSFFDLDLLVSTTGPGSFTGIRVALATLQGLSLASHVPCVGICSFDWVHQASLNSLQRNTEKTKKAAFTPPLISYVILESKREELYVQRYEYSYEDSMCEKGVKSGQAVMLTPQEILEDLKKKCPHVLDKDVLLMGNGAHHVIALEKSLKKICVQDHEGIFMPKAHDLAVHAIALHKDQYQNHQPQPAYVRQPDTTKAKPLFG